MTSEFFFNIPYVQYNFHKALETIQQMVNE